SYILAPSLHDALPIYDIAANEDTLAHGIREDCWWGEAELNRQHWRISHDVFAGAKAPCALGSTFFADKEPAKIAARIVQPGLHVDRKSTRLNSSHDQI